MNKKRYLPLFFCLLTLFLFLPSAAAENLIVVEFYYSATCGSCQAYKPILNQTAAYYERNYSQYIVFIWKEVGKNSTNYNEMHARGLSFPSVIVNNETKIPKASLNYTNLVKVIDAYIRNLSINSFDDEIIDIPFIGKVNTSALSLPIMAIVLGSLDSFNPCSFFILIILLSLLLYLQSKRRMLLVGGIFIFFSGLFYFLFMFVLLQSFIFINTYITVISIVVGVIALIVGGLNIKDFFYYKQGPTLSIPDEKREQTFKRMRKLVKSPSLLAMLTGTIVLAVSVNFFELLCTLGFPLIFTTRLASLNLPAVTYYSYVLLYNIIYVIPLIIILLIFTFTLGKIKLTEWQGRVLKLFPGIVIVSFGLLFILNYQVLENVLYLLAMIGVDVLVTIVIAYAWKSYTKKSAPVE